MIKNIFLFFFILINSSLFSIDPLGLKETNAIIEVKATPEYIREILKNASEEVLHNVDIFLDAQRSKAMKSFFVTICGIYISIKIIQLAFLKISNK